jgi:hypothetical protein
MRRRSAAAGLTAAITALVGLSACTENGSDGDKEQSAEETKVSLVDLLNENERLFAELYETEPKVTRACLEEQGFTVHDEMALYQHYAIGVDQGGLQEDYYDFQTWLPETEMAADWGFGHWLWHGDENDDDLLEEYNALLYPEETEVVEEEYPDNSAFEALDAEEKIAWYTAFMGEAKMEYEDRAWRLRHPDATEEEIGGRLSEIQNVEDDGSIEGDLEIVPPDLGGCELTMIESLYGEPELVQENMEMEDGTVVEEGMAIYNWEYRPKAPAVPPNDSEAIAADTAAVTDAFLGCVADRGFGEWQFVDDSWMPLTQYFDLVYYGESTSPEEGMGDSEEIADSMPELPEDLPSDFEGKKAYEIDMAVAFAGCADEVEYRETVMAAYDKAELAAYEAVETELFAYQEALRAALATAQDLL